MAAIIIGEETRDLGVVEFKALKYMVVNLNKANTEWVDKNVKLVGGLLIGGASALWEQTWSNHVWQGKAGVLIKDERYVVGYIFTTSLQAYTFPSVSEL